MTSIISDESKSLFVISLSDSFLLLFCLDTGVVVGVLLVRNERLNFEVVGSSVDYKKKLRFLNELTFFYD